MGERLHVDYTQHRTSTSEESDGAWELREEESNDTAQDGLENRAIAPFACSEPLSSH